MIARQADRPSGGRTRRFSPVAGATVAAFLAGALFGTQVLRPASAQAADPHRVFQLMIYHTKHGQASALESVFRKSWKLQAQHHLDVLGYWVPNEDPAWNDIFIYLIAHPSRAEADAHWKEFHADPAVQPLRNAAAALIQQADGDYRVDEIYMRSADYSALK
jgi:hypothetical protein